MKANEDQMAKSGMGGFKASMTGGGIVDSDSDLGSSSDDNAKFDREQDEEQQEGEEQSPSKLQEGEAAEINADLDEVASQSLESPGVLIPAPDRENNVSMLETEHAIVPEEAAGEDEDQEEEGEGAANAGAAAKQ